MRTSAEESRHSLPMHSPSNQQLTKEERAMSKETALWLNTQVLIGMKETRPKYEDWSYNAELDALNAESTRYEGFIPVADVHRRLFSWTAEETEMYISRNGEFVIIPDRKVIVRSDTGAVLGAFKESYNAQNHQYGEWCLNGPATVLSAAADALGVRSAGLLAGGARAWVEMTIPEAIEVAGFAFRPNLLAATSFDGTLASQYMLTIGAVVCDNTLAAALSEDGPRIKVKHTKHSGLKVAEARDLLGIVFKLGEDFSAEVEKLTQWEVSDKQWSQHLDLMVPVPTDSDNKRGITVAEQKRSKISDLYNFDARCEPWKGTALGVLQAHNTYQTHYAQVRKGADRGERNMDNVLSGKFGNADELVISNLALVTAS